MLEVSRDGRKHSLPQLLDSTGTSQVNPGLWGLWVTHRHYYLVRDENTDLETLCLHDCVCLCVSEYILFIFKDLYGPLFRRAAH